MVMKHIIKKILKEELDNNIKNLMIKRWDKEKSQGNIPQLYSKKEFIDMGFSEPEIEGIIETYKEYMGDVYEIFNKFLIDNTFTTKDIEDLGINIGTYDFEFKIMELNGDLKNLEVFFNIIDGEVDVADEGIVKLTPSGVNSDDMSINFEVQFEIGDLISSFVYWISKKFGFDKIIDISDVQWVKF